MQEKRINLSSSHFLHVRVDTMLTQVWLNIDQDFDGLCIGVGDTLEAAIGATVATLREAIGVLAAELDQ
jgi:hypothetical protein